MLSLYLIVTAVVAVASLVTFVSLGRRARVANVPVVDVEAGERFLRGIDRHDDKNGYGVKAVGPSEYTYCSYGADHGWESFKTRRKYLCADHQKQFDKVTEPKADLVAARRYARGSMRAWAAFISSPLWPIGLSLIGIHFFLVGSKTGKEFWKDVRTMAEHATAEEIEEDRLLHMALDPRVMDAEIEATRQPVYYDKSLEKMMDDLVAQHENDTTLPELYEALSNAVAKPAPKGSAPRQGLDRFYDKGDQSPPGYFGHSPFDSLCQRRVPSANKVWAGTCSPCQKMRSLDSEY